MKLKNILIVLCIIAFTTTFAFAAQNNNETKPKRDYYSSLYIGANYSYSLSSLNHINLMFDTESDPTMYWNQSPSFEIFYMFSKVFGLGTGVKMGTFSSNINTPSFNKQFTTTEIDIDGDNFLPIMKATQLSQSFSLETLNVPLFIKFKFGSFYIDLGAIFSKFRNATYTLNGTAIVQGFYPDYNVTLSNIPEYNYTTTNYVDYKEKFDAPSVNYSATMAMGFFISLHRNVALKIGVNGLYGSTNLKYSQERQNDLYRITATSTKNTKLISYGAEVGFYIKFLNNPL